jgi:hypothetical protein
MSMTNLCVTTSPPSCTHTIRLTDTYGDGWNGGTITVTVNGVPVLTDIALTGTTGPEDYTFSASNRRHYKCYTLLQTAHIPQK